MLCMMLVNSSGVMSSLPIKWGSSYSGSFFSHFNVLVDTAHKCGLAFIQFPSIIDDSDGEHHDDDCG